MEQQTSKFEGWALLELMGHQREIGFVTTEYFGGAALFRVDTPELPERDITLARPEWLDVPGRGYAEVPKGSVVKRAAVAAKSRFVAPGALYALNPCTEDAARKAIEDSSPRPIVLVTFSSEPTRALLPGEEPKTLCDCGPDEFCEECNPR